MPTNQAVGNTKDYNQYSDLNETDMQGGQEPLKVFAELFEPLVILEFNVGSF